MHVKEKINLTDLISVINAEISAALEQGDGKVEDSGNESLELGRFICVRVAGKEMAIEISSVTEVGEIASVRSLPLLPEWVSGIVNIRGKIVSVIDLGRFLEYPLPLPSGRQPFIMLRHDSCEMMVTVEKIIQTRILFQRGDMRETKAADFSCDDFISGSAWYEQDGEWHSIPLFDLKQFFSSQKFTGSAD